MATTHSQILEAEQEVKDLKRTYLQRWGWKMTCNSPGAYWVWKRDFADIDARRKAWDDEHEAGKPGKPTPSQPYGIITATTDLAVSMTVRCLDEQPELQTDEAA